MDLTLFRNRLQENVGSERTEQAHFQQANFFAAFLQRSTASSAAPTPEPMRMINRSASGGPYNRTSDIYGRCAGKTIHHVLNDRRAAAVIRIAGFARLEKDVGVLRGAAKHRAVGRKAALAMLPNEFVVDDGAQIIVLSGIDHVHFVRGAETIEEMQEGDARFKGGGLRDQAKSLASWTELEASIANPVARVDMTSL